RHMGADLRHPANRPPHSGLWRVRIRSRASRAVLGAGILLDTDTVLTCAHVITDEHGQPDPNTEVLVELLAVPDARPVPAWVAEDGWKPQQADQRADVALLKLSVPQPPEYATLLRRQSPRWRQPVNMYGFPASNEHGMLFRATLDSQAGPQSEWVQMTPDTPADTVRRGFSGAAVEVSDTGHVIGMVVSRYDDPPDAVPTGQRRSLSYMIPTETILYHLPVVTQWVHGRQGIDRRLVSELTDGAQDVEVARRLTRWLRRGSIGLPSGDAPVRNGGDMPARNGAAPVQNGGEGQRLGHGLGLGLGMQDVETLVITDEESDKYEALRRAVTLASRELSGGHSLPHVTRRPHGTVPPVGSVDLAVVAQDWTPADLERLVADRMGLRTHNGTSPTDLIRTDTVPLTIVAVGVDRAPDPDGLLRALSLIASRGGKLLIVFHDPRAPGLALAEELFRPDPKRVDAWLARLGEEVERLRLAGEEARSYVGDLHIARSLLRADPDLRSYRVLPKLAAFEHAVASVRAKAEAGRRAEAERARAAEESERARKDLDGLLTAAVAKLGALGAAERDDMVRLRRAAQRALNAKPFVPQDAEEAVYAFTRAVTRAEHGGPPESDGPTGHERPPQPDAPATYDRPPGPDSPTPAAPREGPS
ncbi:serine protease, partial [Streptomyces sp. NPDC057654]|uniref:S1 family peptidase n=1 Tax=Streptomyces sp. NPDC057654 TaxID=3346196 RepID=UPI003673F443